HRVRGAARSRARGPGRPARRTGAAACGAAGDVGVRRVPAGGDPEDARSLEGAPRGAGCRREAPRAPASWRPGLTGADQPAIVATGLRKAFGEVVVLGGVDLTVAEGTIFALLGPNGAGKTTIVRILSTLISPDAGHVRVAGHELRDDPNGVRAAIGVTGQFSAVDDLLTGEENLRLMADLNHL